MLDVAAKAIDRMIHDVRELHRAQRAACGQLERRSPRRRATRAKRSCGARSAGPPGPLARTTGRRPMSAGGDRRRRVVLEVDDERI